MNSVTLEFCGRAYQECAYKLAAIWARNVWLDVPCCVIGGGESFKQVPVECLVGKKVIGVNRGAEFFDVDIWYFGDVSYYEKMEQMIYKDVNKEGWSRWNSPSVLKVCPSPITPYVFKKCVWAVRRLLKPEITRDFYNGIYPGGNSGLGALVLAIALGANPIYLLGFDMKMKVSDHWHSGYPGQDKISFKRKLQVYRKEIERLVPLIDKVGVKVYNAYEDSELKCFPYRPVPIVRVDAKQEAAMLLSNL